MQSAKMAARPFEPDPSQQSGGQRRRARASIRSRLVLLLSGVALPLLALNAWLLYQDARANERHAREQVYRLAQITASQTASVLGRTREILSHLAAQPRVRALDPNACDPLLNDVRVLGAAFANVLTVDVDGALVCSALAAPTGMARAPFTSWVPTKSEVIIGTPVRGPVSGRWVVPMAQRLYSPQGRFVGAVGISLDLLNLPVLPSLDAVSANARAGINTAGGVIVARSHDADLVGTDQSARSVVQTITRQRNGTAQDDGLDGAPRIVGFTPVPGTDWIAAVSLPAADIYEPVRRRALASAVAALAIIALAIILAVAWSRRIAQPLAELAGTAREVAAGNLDARARMGGVEELAVVTEQFNRMLDVRVGADRDRAAAELRDRALVEALGEIVYDWRPADDEIIWEGRYSQVLGYSREEMGTTTASRLDRVHPGDLPAVKAEVESATRQHRKYSLEYRFRHRDGSYRWMEDSGIVFVSGDGKLQRILGVFTDVTRRRTAQQARRDLARRLMESEETERRKLNRELHDRVAANLSAASLGVSLARSQCSPEAGSRLKEIEKLLAETVGQARDLMAELSPPGLAEFGLLPALSAHAERMQARAALDVEVRGNHPEPRPSLAVETALFRIAQEGLNNVLKHAGTNHAVVMLDAQDHGITLTVADAGAGFDPGGASAARGWGMRTMRERADAIGATLEVDAVPGRGTRVSVVVPAAG